MAINVHFFRDNSLEKFDYGKLLEYFDEQPNFKIYYTNDEVEIVSVDSDFKFTYRFLITKKSRVNKIYKLNPIFGNINFLLEMPILIPTFIAKEILNLVGKICKTFELQIYNDSFEDVQAFDLANTLDLFSKERAKQIESKGLEGKIAFNKEKLDEICGYQRQIHSIKEVFHNEVEVNPCEPIFDKTAKEFGICAYWNVGMPTVFPPHLDYVSVKDEDNVVFLIRRKEFFTFMGSYLTELNTVLKDMYKLSAKQAKKSKKIIGKMRKVAVVGQSFTSLRLCDLIDVDA